MEAAAANPMIQRMIGAARLDVHTYEEVEHDRDATTQAAIVVVVVAIASGIGSIGTIGVVGLIGITISSLIGWALFAFLAYFVGTRWLAGPQTSADWGELARTLAFAFSPGVLLILGIIPVLGLLVSLLVFVWVVVAVVIAIRAALDFETSNAIITAVIAFVGYVVVYGVASAILSSV